MELFFSFLKFATLGLATEVIFTSVTDNIGRIRSGQKIDWSLKGHSYIWMIPIYGSIALLAPYVINPMQVVPYFLRLLLYSLVILLVEYVSGLIIKQFTGRCPWHYETGLHIHHLIRIDYIPAWMGFAAIVEYLFHHY